MGRQRRGRAQAQRLGPRQESGPLLTWPMVMLIVVLALGGPALTLWLLGAL
jgi:hypothetical protein